MEEAIMLYPSPAMGHLLSMVELGKLLMAFQPSLSVHILVVPAPYQDDVADANIAAASSAAPAITFLRLPKIDVPPSMAAESAFVEYLVLQILRLSVPHVRRVFGSISESAAVRALVTDFFFTEMVPLAAELGVPGYYYFTTGASFLSADLVFPSIHRSLKDMKTRVEIPGLPPVPSSDLPKPWLNREDKAYQCCLDISLGLRKPAGIIVNTFESLEPRALKAISEGLCVPEDPTPPIYCVGPVIVKDDPRSGAGDGATCLQWLDSQAPRSVVFLCFGSLGAFSAEQTKEIAIGLERSGKRFLWVVRRSDEEDTIEGFLERTRGKGLVMRGWAPQAAVLSHDSVGGFVTHCGWNSVLEAVSGGVPMIAWPLYAEQRFNKVVLVEEIKIALPLNESANGFVAAEEVEKRVRQLMDSEEGELVRRRTMAMRDDAKAALHEGGSSHLALTQLVGSWKNKGP